MPTPGSKPGAAAHERSSDPRHNRQPSGKQELVLKPMNEREDAAPEDEATTADLHDDVVARVLARAEGRAAGYELFPASEGAQSRTPMRSDSDGDQLDLEERNALRRVAGLSTELEDVTEVEYRQLRLERVVLIGVYQSGGLDDAENSLRELVRARRDRGRGRARRTAAAAPAPRSEHLPRQGQGGGAARHGARARRRHRDRRHRARPEPAARARGRRQGQGHRPHRRHPRHLQPARQEPRGQGAGRARAARVPAPAPPRLGRLDVPPGRWPGGRRGCRHGIARSR